MRTSLEVAHIITRFKDAFLEKYSPCKQVLKVFSHLEQCRTSALGGHMDACSECGAVRVSYNSCRDRHCPKCQGIERELWIQARKEEILPVNYFHVVFTLPEELHSLSLANMKAVYNSLFKTAWGTIEKFSGNQGVQTGMTAILHTWGSNLHYHPHVHCIVPGGGIREDGKWKTYENVYNRKAFLFTVKGMSKVFRAKFMKELTKSVKIPAPVRKRLFEKEWVVYSKAPFKGTDKVVEYLGRYSYRVAISNSRIKQITDRHVTFEYKDYKDNRKCKMMTLTGEEFLHRFSQHILPAGFVRIRHYGFLASSNREKLWKIQRVMKVPCSPIKGGKKKWTEVCAQKWEDYNICKSCAKAQMITIQTFHPTRAPPVLMRRKGDTQEK